MDQQIKQIKEMESILNRYEAVSKTFDKALDDLAGIQADYLRLKDYYFSEAYEEALDRDQAGEFPQDLHRGVLSEDAIYNAISDNHRFAVQMLELATAIIRDH